MTNLLISARNPLLLGILIISLGVTFSFSAGCKPIAGNPGKDGKEQAISLVQGFELLSQPPETIKGRIERIIELSRKAGMKEEVVGWSAYQLDDNRYYVFFSLRENDKWIGFEWFVNLNNGWVNPTNQYAAWLMIDKQW